MQIENNDRNDGDDDKEKEKELENEFLQLKQWYLIQNIIYVQLIINSKLMKLKMCCNNYLIYV